MSLNMKRLRLKTNPLHRATPLKTAAFYVLGSCLWILLGNYWLISTVNDHWEFVKLTLLGETIYVLLTAILFFIILYRSFEKLGHQAHHDTLTGLPNRMLFNELSKQAIAQSRRKQSQLAILFLDLDRFKLINDTMGHSQGDLLLKAVAARIRETLREGDTIARQGGDEFLVLLPEISQEQEAVKVAERILDGFSRPFMLDEREVYMNTSIGISIYPSRGSDIETLVKQADTAMYYAKELGRNNCQLFTYGQNLKANERLSLENSLRKALERNEFILYYQPQIDFDGTIVGVEALVRWNSEKDGMVSPQSFIPIAEETGLIIPLGEWVLTTACEQAVSWQTQGYPPVRMAVNISARQFREENFRQRVAEILAKTGLEPKLLELEITESLAMESGETMIELLKLVKGLGVRISIDDFGSGFSSLNYLRRMPIDTLKIDQSFIRDISISENGQEVVSTIIQMAKNLKLRIIAEGVETDFQWLFLKEKRCDEMQGFLFSKAVPPGEMEQFLAELQSRSLDNGGSRNQNCSPGNLYNSDLK